MVTIEKNRAPYFSVIIPTYNREKLLNRAVDSVKMQTESDWETVIVDDGSNDNTFQLIKSIIEEDGRFRYIYQKNRGQALTKNAGILASSGLFITFLDSDDEYKPEHLSIRREIMQDYDEIDLLYGGVEIIGPKQIADINDNSRLVPLEDCIIGGTFVMKKSTAYELGGFNDIKVGEDVDFYKRAKALGFNVAKTNEKTYIYHRDHNDSICHRFYSPDNEISVSR